MSSIDSPSDDQVFFQAIEETFIRLRGAPLLLSPADWQLAREWRRLGIPLELVLTTLEEVFQRHAARGRPGKIRGLRYCAEAVERAWAERRELAATDERRAADELDVEGRLRALSQALPADLPERASLADRLRALSGSAEAVEQQLVSLDRRLLETAAARLEPSASAEVDREVEQALARFAQRLSQAERQRLGERLWREAIRRRLGLPMLSLFAPEADRTNSSS